MATKPSTDRMTTREIYMRHVDQNGKSSVQSHFVWDADLFVAARKEEAKAANAKETDEAKRHCYVEQITQDDYRKAMSK